MHMFAFRMHFCQPIGVLLIPVLYSMSCIMWAPSRDLKAGLKIIQRTWILESPINWIKDVSKSQK